jgi:hypothetical protein
MNKCLFAAAFLLAFASLAFGQCANGTCGVVRGRVTVIQAAPVAAAPVAMTASVVQVHRVTRREVRIASRHTRSVVVVQPVQAVQKK